MKVILVLILLLMVTAMAIAIVITLIKLLEAKETIHKLDKQASELMAKVASTTLEEKVDPVKPDMYCTIYNVDELITTLTEPAHYDSSIDIESVYKDLLRQMSNKIKNYVEFHSEYDPKLFCMRHNCRLKVVKNK